MSYEQRPNSCLLFSNRDKESDKHPDFKGVIDIQDVGQFYVAMWKRQSEKAGEFFSVSVKLKQQRQEEAPDF